MIRSVLKLTPEDFKRLRSKMNLNTVKQKEAKEKFNLSHTERAMLIELEKLLSTFEWMTNEFQGIVLILIKKLLCFKYILKLFLN